MTYLRIVVLSVLNLLAVYLFVAAPAPLPEAGGGREAGDARIPIAAVFEALNTINSEARRIYTARVVGPGKEANLAFSEDWRDPGKEAGPLPALFFRLVASDLTRQREPLSLFLGSDAPINPSNRFTGEQTGRFELIKQDGLPQVFRDSDRNQVGMFADPASAKPCVSCHNDHTASPKKDWRLDDVMGAATWIYPDAEVSPATFSALVRNVYAGVETAWATYLAKSAGFADPPRVGPAWPGKDSRTLPDPKTFLDEVYRASAPAVLRVLNDHLAPPAKGRAGATNQAALRER